MNGSAINLAIDPSTTEESKPNAHINTEDVSAVRDDLYMALWRELKYGAKYQGRAKMSRVQFQGGFSESSLMAATSFMMEPLKFYDVSHAAEQQTICLSTTSTQMLPLLRDLSQFSRCRCAVKEPVSEKWCQKLIIKGLEPLSYKLRLRDLGLLSMKKQKILKLI